MKIISGPDSCSWAYAECGFEFLVSLLQTQIYNKMFPGLCVSVFNSFVFSCWTLLNVAVLAKPYTVATVDIVLQLWAGSTVGAINHPRCLLCQQTSTLATLFCKLKQCQRQKKERYTSPQLGDVHHNKICAFILSISVVLRSRGTAPWSPPSWEPIPVPALSASQLFSGC